MNQSLCVVYGHVAFWTFLTVQGWNVFVAFKYIPTKTIQLHFFLKLLTTCHLILQIYQFIQVLYFFIFILPFP